MAHVLPRHAVDDDHHHSHDGDGDVVVAAGVMNEGNRPGKNAVSFMGVSLTRKQAFSATLGVVDAITDFIVAFTWIVTGLCEVGGRFRSGMPDEAARNLGFLLLGVSLTGLGAQIYYMWWVPHRRHREAYFRCAEDVASLVLVATLNLVTKTAPIASVISGCVSSIAIVYNISQMRVPCDMCKFKNNSPCPIPGKLSFLPAALGAIAVLVFSFYQAWSGDATNWEYNGSVVTSEPVPFLFDTNWQGPGPLDATLSSQGPYLAHPARGRPGQGFQCSFYSASPFIPTNRVNVTLVPTDDPSSIILFGGAYSEIPLSLSGNTATRVYCLDVKLMPIECGA